MNNIVILTGSELRHTFFRMKMAANPLINVLKTFCEAEQNLLANTPVDEAKSKRAMHLQARQQSEVDFFETYVTCTNDQSLPETIERGHINKIEYAEEIIALQPDLVIVYGASIIKEPLLSAFEGKMLNVHLGLSPYYRGSATNFYPLVDGLPECVGATFMFIDAGIDTGEIIHQIRPHFSYWDTPSAIGNRLIKQMTDTFCQLIINFDSLVKTETTFSNTTRRYCRKKDYTDDAVAMLYNNFNHGMIENYLTDKTTRDQSFPLGINSVLSYDESNYVPLC